MNATKRFSQVVAERIFAGLEKFQAHFGEFIKKLERRRVSQTEGLHQRGLRLRSSSKSRRATGKLRVSGSDSSPEHARRTSDISIVSSPRASSRLAEVSGTRGHQPVFSSVLRDFSFAIDDD